jgi:hypothetical protein
MPLKIEEDLNLKLLVTKSFSAKMLATFEESVETVKKFYSSSPLFIGVRGQFQEMPRFDRCDLSGGRVSTPTFRG